MAYHDIHDLPAYLQNSQIVKDCKEIGNMVVFCPYEIPPTSEINRLNDLKKLYFVTSYFSLDFYDEFTKFANETSERVLLLDFLDNVDVMIVNFDKLYGELAFKLFTHTEYKCDDIYCVLCKNWCNRYRVLPCYCISCEDCCEKVKITAKCPLCDNPIFIKRHKFIAKGCETHV